MSPDNTNPSSTQTNPATGGNPGAPAVNLAGQTVLDPAKLQKFDIPQVVKDKYPDLINLILITESMNDEERQYWFQILPIMTAEQVEKFRKILDTEKEQLAKLDQEYETELKKLNDKHLVEWQEFEAKEKRQKLQSEEGKNQKEEKQIEEDLLSKLDDPNANNQNV